MSASESKIVGKVEVEDKNIFEWIKPDIYKEINEIERTVKELGLTNSTESVEVITRIQELFQNGSLEVLDDTLWSQLENSDSWKNIEKGNIGEALEYAEEYHKNYHGILKAYKEGLPIHASIIVIKSDGTPYLIAGNTRLMISRGLAMNPKVWLFKLK